MKNNNHGDSTVEYLNSVLGYDISDIVRNDRRGMPDITTKSDEKEWEEKILKSPNAVIFTMNQILEFKDDVNIVIFVDKLGRDRKFLEILRFGDIINQSICFGYIHKEIGIRFDYRFFTRLQLDLKDAKIMLKIYDKIIERELNILRYESEDIIRKYIDVQSNDFIRALIYREFRKDEYAKHYYSIVLDALDKKESSMGRMKYKEDMEDIRMHSIECKTNLEMVILLCQLLKWNGIVNRTLRDATQYVREDLEKETGKKLEDIDKDEMIKYFDDVREYIENKHDVDTSEKVFGDPMMKRWLEI